MCIALIRTPTNRNAGYNISNFFEFDGAANTS